MVKRKKAKRKSFMQVFINNNAIEAKKKYYPQTLLEECKYEQERIVSLIDDDLEKSEYDESDSETKSDNDNDE